MIRRSATARLPLFAAVGVAVLVGLLALLLVHASTALLLGWCAGAITYLALALRIGFTMSRAQVRILAAAIDEGRNTVLSATLAATLISLAAVVVELGGSRGTPGASLSALLAGLTIALSWSFVHVLFAHRYMHEHALRGGLDFPGDDTPDFCDFLYLAFTIGMTAQVSDVTTTAPAMRRLVLVHALVAFIFNAAVLATAVNIAASLAG
jgi:uncharacterized membrane protein